jgi:NTP pyrophosphatase (non-canonical NTP hydrolase)
MANEPNALISSLEDIWPAQAHLNQTAGIDTLGLGKVLLTQMARTNRVDQEQAMLDVGKALKNYVDGLMAECQELQDCLAWKHWYREAKQGRQYELRDVQNARVEATDMLFFWVSICQLLGLSPNDVYRLYAKKLAINQRRQSERRTQMDHSAYEDENRTVT